MKTRHAALVTLSLLLTGAASSRAEDWTRLRGKDGSGTGILPGLPTTLDKESMIWARDLNGKGHSAPVIFGKKLFYTVVPDAADQTHEVVCVSTDTGKSLWTKSYNFKAGKIHQFNSQASSTACVDDKRLYVWWGNDEQVEVLALTHDGEEVWKTPLGSFESQHGTGSSLVVVDDILIVPKENLSKDSFVAGLDTTSGTVVWKHELLGDKTPYSTPAIRRSGDRVEAIFSSTVNGIYSLDPKSGKLNWKYDPKFTQRCVGSPTLLPDNRIYANSGQGGGGVETVVIQVAPGSADIVESYRLTKNLAYVPTAISFGEWIFILTDGGIVSCVDAATGETLWRERVLAQCFCSPVCVNGVIYAFGRDGDYMTFRASDKYEPLAKGSMGDPVHATPALGDGKLFIRTDRQLLCIPGKDAA